MRRCKCPGCRERPAYKVLPLPSYVPFMVQRCEHRWEVGKPVIGKDGWYHDRLSKTTWFEYDGKAYFTLGDSSDFNYHLEVSCCDTSFTEKEAAAVRLLLGLGKLRWNDRVVMAWRAWTARRQSEMVYWRGRLHREKALKRYLEG